MKKNIRNLKNLIIEKNVYYTSYCCYYAGLVLLNINEILKRMNVILFRIEHKI